MCSFRLYKTQRIDSSWRFFILEIKFRLVHYGFCLSVLNLLSQIFKYEFKGFAQGVVFNMFHYKA